LKLKKATYSESLVEELYHVKAEMKKVLSEKELLEQSMANSTMEFNDMLFRIKKLEIENKELKSYAETSKLRSRNYSLTAAFKNQLSATQPQTTKSNVLEFVLKENLMLKNRNLKYDLHALRDLPKMTKSRNMEIRKYGEILKDWVNGFCQVSVCNLEETNSIAYLMEMKFARSARTIDLSKKIDHTNL
jgi:predicted nuclease with TOPRIM domain